MRTPLLVLLVVLISFPIVAQQPAIVSISPSSGPASGLSFVLITLEGMGSGCPGPACEIVVRFGGVAATRVVIFDDEHLTALTPPHVPGTVSVTVERSGMPAVSATDVYTYVSLESFFEKVLIPVTTWGPGAFDSQWLTEIVVHNRAFVNVELGNKVFDFGPCDSACGCEGRNIAFAQVTQFVSECQVPSDPAGMILHVPRKNPENTALEIQVRVRDVSRDFDDWGTQIPVVRERDLRSEIFSILNVPTDSRYRLRLRVFAPDRDPNSEVGVWLYNAVTGEQLGNQVLPLMDDGAEPVPTIPALRPGFAQIDLLSTFPRMSEADTVRVEIAPGRRSISELPEQRIRVWAMITATNNNSQRVTIISPD